MGPSHLVLSHPANQTHPKSISSAMP
uniref:Uncharacterized protein n=1 Tax=Arundo donax TaxID=35708 RepID=A0A0A9FSU9_ARUDO